jgi:preprotein translocase subunit SecD
MGMAVDANVLIYERIREELRQGRTVLASVDAGYNRAMSSIIDGHLTTVISGLIMFMLGSGPIKGFAVTLTLGILTSMFAAIMITRLMMLRDVRNSKGGINL